MAIAIVGGDSRLAKTLLACSNFGNQKIYVTTRRPNNVNDRYLFLDLSSSENFLFPDDVDKVAIVGGAVSYAECEDNFDQSHYINCVSIPSLVKRALSKGIFVNFVSSNRVFTATIAKSENDPPNPTFAYTKLKSEAEKRILSVAQELGQYQNLSILRLTKNVSLDTAPFGDWLDSLQHGDPIVAFRDLYFAPILYADSTNVLMKILNQRLPGIFHLSGERDLSYYEFACGLCEHLQLAKNLVVGKRSEEVGVTLVDKHNVTALSMIETGKKLQVSPVPVSRIYEFFGSNFKKQSSCI